MTPRSTYRLQLHKDFGFVHAAALAPYLAELGISHVYCSPYLKARPGSTHGYDIVDHGALNPELGSDADFAAMSESFRAHGLSQILDFVPNHMGVGGADNPQWLDVLEWGVDSASAGWFDIEWDPERSYLHGKVLVPFLGDQYGVELHAGNLQVNFDESAGSFAVWAYGTHKMPISPLHYPLILRDRPELERLSDAFADLGEWRPEIAARAVQLKAELAELVAGSGPARQAIAARLERFNGTPGDAASWDPLDQLISIQAWRTAHFRTAGDDINYRRFFNINDLAGLRMEIPAVFEQAHRKVAELLEAGVLDGLRIDHVDGLLDPKQYLQQLRSLAPAPIYLVVEKILAPHESLREDWPVAGTTGYEFANLVLGLLMNRDSESAFTQAYATFTGDTRRFSDVVRASKMRIMENEMASELHVLSRHAARVARENIRTTDFTRNLLQRALKEIVAAFPVYRTYIDSAGSPSESDRRDLDWAIAQAKRNDIGIDPSVFDFLHRLLSGDLVAEPRSGFPRHKVLRFAMRLQQYCGPVMAKGLEDTAFYRYNRFVALNEVGGNPEQFGITTAAFHKANRARAGRWPEAMLATSTHDTKRGEDVRARLAVLSEFPAEWLQQVQTWSRILRARRGDVEGTAPPDRADEYLLYQLLLGSWPVEMLDGGIPSAAALDAYAARLKAAMTKSMREAKVRTSWMLPDTAYEGAVLAFIDSMLDASQSNAFLDAFLPFADRIARLGAHNSLVQTVLKLTCPGVPDTYQGAELWDLSLVDPDNRRPVDYALRQRLLNEVNASLDQDRRAAMARFFQDWKDGRGKLAAMATLLQFRAESPDVFAAGSYEGMTAEGPEGDQVCSFLRQANGTVMLVAVALLPRRLEECGIGSDTVLRVPQDIHRGAWRDLLTGQPASITQGTFPVAQLFAQLPAAVLVNE